MNIKRNQIKNIDNYSEDLNPEDYKRYYRSDEVPFYEFVLLSCLTARKFDAFPKAILQIPKGEDRYIYKFIFEIPLSEELTRKHGVKSVLIQDLGCRGLSWIVSCTINDPEIFEFINNL
jgi:hypothetical protein